MVNPFMKSVADIDRKLVFVSKPPQDRNKFTCTTRLETPLLCYVFSRLFVQHQRPNPSSILIPKMEREERSRVKLVSYGRDVVPPKMKPCTLCATAE